jgi:hypothetical protein
MTCSDLCAIHQRKSENGDFSSRLINDEITMRGYKVLICVKCTIIMITELTIMNGLWSIVTPFVGHTLW